MDRIGVEERRARLAVRHHVAPGERVTSAVEAARAVVCLHASDPATVYLSAWARMTDPTIEAVDRALYEDRLLVRMLAMRRTMFVVPVEDAAILHAAASVAVARTERKRNEELVALLGVADADAWIREAEAAALAALERRGEATAQELAEDVPALQKKVRVNVGKRYEADIGMSGRVLLLLALEGKVVRGGRRGRGSAASTAGRRWPGGSVARCPSCRRPRPRRRLSGAGCPASVPGPRRTSAGGPAGRRGRFAARWRPSKPSRSTWTGRWGFVLPDDLEPTPTPEPWVALLPSLDPTTMGWRARDWYLGGHKDALFDTNGNAGPTIWVDGRIVGGWAMRADGEVVTKLLEDVGRDASLAVDAEAARVTRSLQAARVVPRFPTPLHKELVG